MKSTFQCHQIFNGFIDTWIMGKCGGSKSNGVNGFLYMGTCTSSVFVNIFIYIYSAKSLSSGYQRSIKVSVC